MVRGRKHDHRLGGYREREGERAAIFQYVFKKNLIHKEILDKNSLFCLTRARHEGVRGKFFAGVRQKDFKTRKMEKKYFEHGILFGQKSP